MATVDSFHGGSRTHGLICVLIAWLALSNALGMQLGDDAEIARLECRR